MPSDGGKVLPSTMKGPCNGQCVVQGKHINARSYKYHLDTQEGESNCR